jgi:hypothetical protein
MVPRRGHLSICVEPHFPFSKSVDILSSLGSRRFPAMLTLNVAAQKLKSDELERLSFLCLAGATRCGRACGAAHLEISGNV